jgi:hypothetical protein
MTGADVHRNAPARCTIELSFTPVKTNALKLNSANTDVDLQRFIRPYRRTGHHVVIINSVEVNILLAMKSRCFFAFLLLVGVVRAELIDEPIRATSRDGLLESLHDIESKLDQQTRADFSLGWTYLERATTVVTVDSDPKMTAEEKERLLLSLFVGQTPRHVIISGCLAWLSRERWLSARRDWEKKAAVPTSIDGFETEARKILDRYTRKANQHLRATGQGKSEVSGGGAQMSGER